MRRDPTEQILLYGIPAGVVEDLVPRSGIELLTDVRHSGAAEAVVCLLHALSAVTHRVHAAGEKENGRFTVHPPQIFWAADEIQTVQHFPEKPQ